MKQEINNSRMLPMSQIAVNNGQIDGVRANPRQIKGEKFDRLKASIERNPEMLSLRELLVYEHGGKYIVIGGNMRYRACKELGYTQMPCKIIPPQATAEQLNAYIILDNSGFGDWDWDALANEWDSQQLTDWGVDVPNWDDEASEEEQPSDDDDFDEEKDSIECRVKKGEIWQLGKHRLMCGDSIDLEQVKRLLGGGDIDMLFTDPPYNVAFNGRSGKFDVIENDNLSDADFTTFIKRVISVIKALNPKTYYIWCNWKFYGLLQQNLEFKNCIVWAKNVFGMGKGYRHQHEFCLFNGMIDTDITNESDLWEIAKDTNYIHPTQKPTALCTRALNNHRKVKNVLDLFGGSGSTLIACERQDRCARLMEIDPHYCDVIIARWEKMTGEKAIKI